MAGCGEIIGMAEYAAPSLQTLHFACAAETTVVNASEYAERYRIEAERLNDLEKMQPRRKTRYSTISP